MLTGPVKLLTGAVISLAGSDKLLTVPVTLLTGTVKSQTEPVLVLYEWKVRIQLVHDLVFSLLTCAYTCRLSRNMNMNAEVKK